MKGWYIVMFESLDMEHSFREFYFIVCTILLATRILTFKHY